MHFGMNFKQQIERLKKTKQSVSPSPIIPPSFLCFSNKDSLITLQVAFLASCARRAQQQLL